MNELANGELYALRGAPFNLAVRAFCDQRSTAAAAAASPRRRCRLPTSRRSRCLLHRLRAQGLKLFVRLEDNRQNELPEFKDMDATEELQAIIGETAAARTCPACTLLSACLLRLPHPCACPTFN